MENKAINLKHFEHLLMNEIILSELRKNYPDSKEPIRMGAVKGDNCPEVDA